MKTTKDDKVLNQELIREQLKNCLFDDKIETKMNIKPYDKIWFSCVINMKLSILTSIREDYEIVAYDNNYTYFSEIKGAGVCLTEYLKLAMEMNLNLDSDIYKNPLLVEYEDDQSFINKVKKFLEEGKYVSVGVDLFYWAPNSICWNKFHWHHYSLITEYNEEKKEFLFLDDNLYGYGKFSIPEERFIKAVESSEFIEKAYVFELNTTVNPNCISTSTLIENAKKIINNIKDISQCNFWLMDTLVEDIEGFMDLNAMYLLQIKNRQRANLCLLDELEKHAVFDKVKIQEVKELCINLIQGWDLAKNKLIQIYSSINRTEKVIALNKTIKHLFKVEIQMWELFCTIFQSKNIILFPN
jgi:hypothetical protein